MAILVGLTWYGLCVASLLYLRFLPPLTTGVQAQRRVEAWAAGKPYEKKAEWAGLAEISDHLEHAVVAAEDGRFFEHSGFDFAEMMAAQEKAARGGKLRGASTLTQQLIKNLFFTTHRLAVRKVLEAALTPAAELILPKQRILELYLNVIEWGPGVYGAQAAARHHYGVSAARLSRERAARLAAVIPAPLKRRPAAMNNYSAEILKRMDQMGW